MEAVVDLSLFEVGLLTFSARASNCSGRIIWQRSTTAPYLILIPELLKHTRDFAEYDGFGEMSFDGPHVRFSADKVPINVRFVDSNIVYKSICIGLIVLTHVAQIRWYKTSVTPPFCLLLPALRLPLHLRLPRPSSPASQLPPSTPSALLDVDLSLVH